jgi:hypothetical protein
MSILAVLVITMLTTPVMAITWGAEDTDHQNVGLIGVFYDDNTALGICSGVLIEPHVLLTAGHCAEFLLSLDASASVKVSFNGQPNFSDPDDWVEVDDIILHPNYNFGFKANRNDLGLLLLAETPRDVEPAILPMEGFLDTLRAEGKLRHGSNGAKFTVVGYGATLTWPPPDTTYSPVRRQAESEYRALLKAWLKMSQNQATGDGGTCAGDSGGPIFWTEPDGTEDGTEILVGITSWGDPNCVAVSFNYRTDISDTLHFIKDNLKLEGFSVSTIQDILNFFDRSIENGKLEGRGRLANFRPWLMRKMLVIGSNFIEQEQINNACSMLQRAYNRCNTEPEPPDFVVGEAAPQLADMIQNLRTSLGCE